MIESEHEARMRDQEWEFAQEDPFDFMAVLELIEAEAVAGGCTCEKFDDGSGGLTVKPH